jgi:hypothetical protein
MAKSAIAAPTVGSATAEVDNVILVKQLFDARKGVRDKTEDGYGVVQLETPECRQGVYGIPSVVLYGKTEFLSEYTTIRIYVIDACPNAG